MTGEILAGSKRFRLSAVCKNTAKEEKKTKQRQLKEAKTFRIIHSVLTREALTLNIKLFSCRISGKNTQWYETNIYISMNNAFIIIC